MTDNSTDMKYKIQFRCEEGEHFLRVFECNPEATFLDLHKAILASVKYPDDQMTSFFLCNEQWEKEQEVTLIPMGNSFEYDNMVMEETKLSDLLTEQGQRLIYIFDPMFERYFFGALKEILPGNVKGVRCVEKAGKAPEQLQKEESLEGIVGKDGRAAWESDEDFYGDSQYNEDDIDMEGFSDMSFDDSIY